MMVTVTLDLKIGTAAYLLKELERRKEWKAVQSLLDALETQAIPQLDAAIDQFKRILRYDTP